MIADSFHDSFHAVYGIIHLVLSCLFQNIGFATWIVTWIVTFCQMMLVVLDVMYEADTAYSIRSTWLCYGSISHNSIDLLIIAIDFIALS